jgi:hypothetical protein
MTSKTSGAARQGHVPTRWSIALGTTFALLGIASLVRAWLSVGNSDRREFGLFFGVIWLVMGAAWFYNAFRADRTPFTSLLNPPQD